jgi:hypothetical protein
MVLTHVYFEEPDPMNTENKSTGEQKPADAPAQNRKPHTPGEDIKHVVDTWLPPGIEVGEAIDPGSAARGGPAKNRS